MIRGFRHKGLKRLYEDGDRRGLNPQHVEKIETILGLLDVALTVEDLTLPTFRIHPLSGNLLGF